jgi:hypothetical protein
VNGENFEEQWGTVEPGPRKQLLSTTRAAEPECGLRLDIGKAVVKLLQEIEVNR